MPKMKTHSSGKKRFSLTGSGKVKRFKANKSHLLRKRSKTRKRRLAGSTVVTAVEEHRALRMLCKA